jgi:hypothetical protein
MTSAAVNWSLNFDRKSKEVKKIKDILPEFDEYKVETSLVSQCIDLSRKLPCHTIWTAHPMPRISVEGTGAGMRVTKTNPIVSYGNKVAGMIPGSFTEIYHFAQSTDYSTGAMRKRYIVNTEAVGDEFAKSPLLADYVKEFDITDKLFYQVWKDLINKSRGIEEPKPITNIINPFESNATSQDKKWRT